MALVFAVLVDAIIAKQDVVWSWPAIVTHCGKRQRKQKYRV